MATWVGDDVEELLLVGLGAPGGSNQTRGHSVPPRAARARASGSPPTSASIQSVERGPTPEPVSTLRGRSAVGVAGEPPT